MHTDAQNPTTCNRRRYTVEFSISMVAYAVVIYARNLLLHGPMLHADNTSRLLIAWSPLIPVIFLFTAIVRCVQGMDEMMRRVTINSLAIAGGATALLAVTYGFVEGDFFPVLSAWWTYGTFMVLWLVASFFVMRRYK